MYSTITTIAQRNNNYNFQTNNPLEKMDLKLHYDYTSYQVVKYKERGVSELKLENVDLS